LKEKLVAHLSLDEAILKEAAKVSS